MATVGGWRTSHEIDFLMGLGFHRRFVADRLSRLSLLIGYRAGAARRVAWGNVDPLAVLAYVDAEIERLYKKETQPNG